MNMQKNEKGITVIELLIILAVVLLIGIGIYQIFFSKDEIENKVVNADNVEKIEKTNNNIGNLEKVENSKEENKK